MSHSRDRSRSPVHWGSRTDASEGVTELYLSNIPRHWNGTQVTKFVRDVTKSLVKKDISHCKIFKDDLGNFRGTCIVHFNNANACKTALEKLQGVICEGKNLYAALNTDVQNVTSSPRRPTDEVSDTILYVSKLPNPWGPTQIMQFIKSSANSIIISKGIDHVYVKKNKQGNGIGVALIHFSDPRSCKLALEKLHNMLCEGKKLNVRYYITSRGLYPQDNKEVDKSPRVPKQPTEVRSHESYNVPMDSPEQKEDLYGLSMNFLKSLNIKPPLYSTVFIANLHNDVNEERLREVMSYAGLVVRVEIRKRKDGAVRNIATVEFDHPVEAVQAISMFHGQILLGEPMVVCQHNTPRKKFLPEGLSAFGPALGPNGEPLKAVRFAVEVEPKQQFLVKQIEKLSQEIDEVKSKINNTNTATNFGEANMNNTMTQMVAPVNAYQPVYGYNPMALNQAQSMMTGMVQPIMGNEMAMTMQAMSNQSLSAMPVQVVPTPTSNYTAMAPMMQGPSPDQNFITNEWKAESVSVQPQQVVHSDNHKTARHSRHSPDYDDADRPRDKRKSARVSDMLVFNNLPRNVTESVLRNKMREVGEVRMVELTGGGRALVRFAKEEHAERCQNIFHHSKVDGQIIEVDYF